MKAILVDADKNLSWSETDSPAMGTKDIKIKVAATSVNRADLVQRAGFYPPPSGASPILGLECAGEVYAIGNDVNNWNVGDKVCALLTGGGYAEEVVCHEGHALPIPTGMNFTEAAAIIEVFATAWLNLYLEAHLKVNERALIHAGASGVGSAAIQLCREFNNPCFITAGDNNKINWCKQLGATDGFNRHDGSFKDTVQAWSKNEGVDVILDSVGAYYLNDNIHCLKNDGRLIIIGLMGGGQANLDLISVLMKRIRIIGSTLRHRDDKYKCGVIMSLYKHVWPLFEQGKLKPIIDRVLPITECDQAHTLVNNNQTMGKIVMEL